MKRQCILLCILYILFSGSGATIDSEEATLNTRAKKDSSNEDNPVASGNSNPTTLDASKESIETLKAKNNVNVNVNVNVNSDEKLAANQFELAAGDKIPESLILKKLERYHAEKVGLVKRDAHRNWPLGIINYYLDTASYDFVVGQRLRATMDMIESASCVQFHPRLVMPQNNSGAWLHITNPELERKCVHTPEYKKDGEIVVVLGLDCLKRRDILHTLLHAIGFNDEIAHPQRDQYVRVVWQNIQPIYRPLFNVMESSPKHMVEYDPMSIMHFHDRAFSINGKATIAALIPGLQINPSDKLSQLDKMKLRLFFGHECNRRKVDDLLDTCKNVLKTKMGADWNGVGDALASDTNADKSKSNSKDKPDFPNLPNMHLDSKTQVWAPPANSIVALPPLSNSSSPDDQRNDNGKKAALRKFGNIGGKKKGKSAKKYRSVNKRRSLSKEVGIEETSSPKKQEKSETNSEIRGSSEAKSNVNQVGLAQEKVGLEIFE